MLPHEVTVVIPTRNESWTIPTFLRSLPSAVGLVVVDASQDATAEVVRTLRPQNTRVIRHLGTIAQARQIGAEAAGTPWLLFSDVGVSFETGYFSRLARYDDCDALYGPKIASQAHPRSACYRGLLLWQRFAAYIRIPAATGANMLVDRAALDQVGGFDVRLTLDEDSELLWRLRWRGYRVRFAPDLVVADRGQRHAVRGAARAVQH